MAGYIHGTTAAEQRRLDRLNRLTNPAFGAFLDLAPGERALEVGSGLGILSAEVAAALAPGLLAAVERAAPQLAAAGRVPGQRARFARADAARLPFAAASFDLVFARYLLEHVGDPLAALREMLRVLRPGGRLAVQENDNFVVQWDPPCPRFARVWRRFCALQRRLGGDPGIGRRLFRLLQAAGFARIELSLQPEIHASGSPEFGPWVENFIALLAPVRDALAAAGLVSTAQTDAACRELAAFRERRDATAIFYWNRARGWKRRSKKGDAS